ncbi:MAG: 2-hydroxychromene-2-carboxylate isomerase [Xanthobacteraceae bacterium]|nr:2-hydroxychromene-2-carboxylate isomerase [Xanthobacteraceae bacterium]
MLDRTSSQILEKDVAEYRKSGGKLVEFFYEFGSPTSYLAYTQLPRVVQRTGAKIWYRPFLLGGLYKIVNNHSPAENPIKAKWMFDDLLRFAKRYGVDFVNNKHFPINTLPIMRGAIFAEQKGELLKYSTAIYDAIWKQGRNLQEPAEIAAVLKEGGFDAKAYFAGTEDAGVKAKLKAVTEEAASRGVFGAPTYFVGDEMHFGQDRLDFVEVALAR